ncbi:hypothetical protein EDD21DRAFT_374760 [Dissophora ornata]|nr:hypothetical protein EDD21DRAFT_374760 [Dissophora ornata]
MHQEAGIIGISLKVLVVVGHHGAFAPMFIGYGLLLSLLRGAIVICKKQGVEQPTGTICVPLTERFVARSESHRPYGCFFLNFVWFPLCCRSMVWCFYFFPFCATTPLARQWKSMNLFTLFLRPNTSEHTRVEKKK